MGKRAGKRKAPLVGLGAVGTSLKAARRVTSEFHRAERALEAARRGGDRGGAAAAREQLDALGGRQAYQEASILTTAKHRTAKFVFAALTRHGLRPGAGEPPLPLLEVGAVNTQLVSVPWLETRAIDLRSQHPRIEQRDFFDLEPRREFGAVVSAMVLNCVPTPTARGEMLQRCRGHLREGGILFAMVPLRCLTCSRFCTWALFRQLVECCGFEVLETKESPKVAFLCARRVERTEPAAVPPARLRAPVRAVVPGATARTHSDEFAVCLPDGKPAW